MDETELRNRFASYPAKTRKRDSLHQGIRDAGLTAALLINAHVPDGREKSTAVTKLEEAVMWANKGLATHTEL
jgi:hypothetical protein